MTLRRRRFLLLAAAAALQGCGSLVSNEPPAYALVDEAAAKIERTAYYADRVDWKTAIVEAKRLVADPSIPASAHPAIRWLLEQLHDGHSFLLPRERRAATIDNTAVGDLAIDTHDLGDVVVVGVPEFVGSVPIRERAFAMRLHAVFERPSRPRCGWIVDLRRNQGGNMYPMLAGLAPLLGVDDIGRFANRTAEAWWRVREHAEEAGMDASLLQAPDLRGERVAVITSRWTVSSGEAVAIAFRGRPGTRSFGASTGGKSSGNQGATLSDGSMLLVMASLMTDRNGNRYGGPVEPDEPAEATFGPPGYDDAARAAALRWLRGQCVAGTASR